MLSTTPQENSSAGVGERNMGAADPLSGKFFLESWIIDSGAYNHMTHSIDFLIDICEMALVFIKLPDGRLTTTTKQEKVYLRSQLQLLNVFFVDGLQCHLIFLSQFTRDRHCIIQISDLICIVQDRITLMPNGAGKQLNGLYFFF